MGGDENWKNATAEEAYDRDVGRARGVLRGPVRDGAMRHARRSPSPHAARWVAHYWAVSWDLRGKAPYLAETLPHPNVHWVFEGGCSEVSGIHTAKFSRKLEGQGQVFGIKFRPGGFRPFFGKAVSQLADRTLPGRSVFGERAEPLERIAGGSGPVDTKIASAETFFDQFSPPPDENAERAAALVDLILKDPTIRTVDELADRTGRSNRWLQRIFSEYVGVSPKWVIRRYRLHELVERIEAADRVDWAQLALDLGYYDQAHMINDFRTLVGCTPAESRR